MLEVTGIRKNFGDLEVLKGIDFSLEQGETLSIIGASGSGKTTLLRCLNFLESADHGQILVKDQVVYDADDKRALSDREVRDRRLHFGLVFQSFNLFPQYTALKNVTLAKELMARERPDYKQNKKQILEEIAAEGRQVLDNVGLLERVNYYPHQLSGGQQQRVAIARALMLRPDILCFDEPTSALDPELTGEVLRVIRELAAQNTTMVIVTHEMQFAREVSDKILFMDEGIAVEYGTPAEVFEHPSQDRTKKFLERYFNQ
ncbi:MAG: amino acid ABC transporter ATP-binding protein [Lachnospiraceae bacterium]|nr:amino acid ABC transporter ATP-binding protein [Lachnospiraceae bacterium]